MNNQLSAYHKQMGLYREAIQRSDSVARISDDVADKDVLLTWLINFT